MTEIEMEVRISKKLNGTYEEIIPPAIIELKDSRKGIAAAVNGWNKQRYEAAQTLYTTDFGSPMEQTNVKIEVIMKEDNVEIFITEENERISIHFYGNRKYVILGIKGMDFPMFQDVTEFVGKTFS